MAPLKRWKGMWTFLTIPMMSVNCKLTNRTLAFSACSNTRCVIAALSVPGITLCCSYHCRAAAQRSSNLECQLEVEPCFGILQVDPAQQLLDPLQTINERVAMHVQVARGTHVVAAGAQERVEGANEL